MFQSKTRRFITPKPKRIDGVSKQEYKEIADHAALFGPHKQHLYSNSEDNPINVQDSNLYVATIGK